MAVRQLGDTGGPSWSVEDIAYGTLAHDQVRDDQRLFHLLASASFIEITSHLYTRTLVEFFQGDSDVVEWLEQNWVSEELQHGEALKRYVQTAWPDFDWETAYGRFLAEYGQLCTVDLLAGTKTLEMAARCVVEAGTASFYRMLSVLSREPVLKQLAARISTDEVRHYKHFYRYFLRYQAVERPGRAAVLRVLWNRAAGIDAEDAFYAFKAVHLAGNPDTEFQKSDYEAYRKDVFQFGKRDFPREMAVKMLLKPLGLPPMIGRAVVPAVTSATRLFLMR
jgi:hypothetical protein